MDFVESLFRSSYGKVPGTFKDISDIIKSFAKSAAKQWFKHAMGKDPMNAQISESVRVTIANAWKTTVLQNRPLSGDYLGYSSYSTKSDAQIGIAKGPSRALVNFAGLLQACKAFDVQMLVYMN